MLPLCMSRNSWNKSQRKTEEFSLHLSGLDTAGGITVLLLLWLWGTAPALLG